MRVVGQDLIFETNGCYDFLWPSMILTCLNNLETHLIWHLAHNIRQHMKAAAERVRVFVEDKKNDKCSEETCWQNREGSHGACNELRQTKESFLKKWHLKWLWHQKTWAAESSVQLLTTSHWASYSCKTLTAVMLSAVVNTRLPVQGQLKPWRTRNSRVNLSEVWVQTKKEEF